MIKLFFKIGFYTAIVVGGAYLAVNNIPSLKANIIETVNPQVKVDRLVQQLGTNLDTLSTQVVPTGTTTQVSADVVAKNKKLIADSQELISQITDITTPSTHAGVVQQAVTQVASQITGAIFGGSAPTATPSPTTSGSPVTHPSATTMPCVVQ